MQVIDLVIEAASRDLEYLSLNFNTLLGAKRAADSLYGLTSHISTSDGMYVLEIYWKNED